MPGTRRVQKGLFLAVAADVVGDLLLERLEPLEELFRRDCVLRLARPKEPRSGLDGGLPGRFIGAFAVDVLALERLDLVEIDVRELAALLLVLLDARRLALRRYRLARDLLLEGRVLVAVLVAQHEARVAGLRLVGVDARDPDFLLHPEAIPVERDP